MNSTSVFDSCWEAYKQCWSECYENGHLHAIDASAFKEHRWKPDRKARPEDFLADFCLAGSEALERRGAHSRLVLFRLYYLGQAPYDQARHWLGLSEMGWVRWTEEIRSLVGEELQTREIWPVHKYFGDSGQVSREQRMLR
jgi:hypothetical protein